MKEERKNCVAKRWRPRSNLKEHMEKQKMSLLKTQTT